jgi:peptidoglycan/LPS O-acetylase OafA/YrhL
MRLSRARLPAFDWLRAVAVLLVLGRHRDLHPLWHQAGWIGVDLFFVLSGFLVSQLLFNEYRLTSRVSAKRFLIRRAFKIYPGFVALLVVTSAYFVTRKGGLPLDRFLIEAFFLQNYREGLNDHTWSLAVEEHFYFALAACCAVAAQKTKWLAGNSRAIPYLLLTTIVVVAGARIASALLLPYSAHLHFSGTHARIDGLLFGVLISYFYCYERERFCAFVQRRRLILLAASSALLLPALVWKVEELPMYSIGFTLLYLGFGGILACVAAGVREAEPRASGRLAAFAASIGAQSYSIYLWHMPIAGWGMNLLQRVLPFDLNGAAGGLVYLAAVTSTGVLMARLVEYPCLKLRDRWFPPGEELRLPASPTSALGRHA